MITVDNETKATVQVKWNVTFVPYTIKSLYNLKYILPGVQLQFYNLLDRENFVSSFSWTAFIKLLKMLLLEGKLILPHAVIVGTTDYELTTFSILKPSTTTGTSVITTNDNNNNNFFRNSNISKVLNNNTNENILNFASANKQIVTIPNSYINNNNNNNTILIFNTNIYIYIYIIYKG